MVTAVGVQLYIDIKSCTARAVSMTSPQNKILWIVPTMLKYIVS